MLASMYDPASTHLYSFGTVHTLMTASMVLAVAVHNEILHTVADAMHQAYLDTLVLFPRGAAFCVHSRRCTQYTAKHLQHWQLSTKNSDRLPDDTDSFALADRKHLLVLLIATACIP